MARTTTVRGAEPRYGKGTVGLPVDPRHDLALVLGVRRHEEDADHLYMVHEVVDVPVNGGDLFLEVRING